MSMTSPLPLEDNVSDILGKAQRGLSLPDSTLAGRVGVASGELDAVRLLKGASPSLEQRLCSVLQLDYESMRRLAEGKYQPHVQELEPGFYMANTPYGDMNVNAYLIWDPVSRFAAIFDTGTDGTLLLAEIQRHHLTLQDVFLTHTHGDHVAELDRLLEKNAELTGEPNQVAVHVAEAEAGVIPGSIPFQPGVTFALGKLHVETRDTSGHSEGGTSFCLHGLNAPLTIVGDALFAGSVGGIRTDYKVALQRIREQILSAQDNTILAPGHGPLTTVIQEKENNPFFPEFKKVVAAGI